MTEAPLSAGAERAWTTGAVEVDDRTITYHRTGGSGPALILLHGLSDSASCWSRVANDLEDAFDVVMPDARGHGGSSRLGRDGFSLARLTADVAGLMRELGIDQATVFGHSMGAITALHLAARHPGLVSRLVLEDPPLDLPQVDPAERRGSIAADIEPWRAIDSADRYRRATLRHPGWDPEEIEPWLDSKLAFDLAILDHLDLFDDTDWRRCFASIQQPGLLITGERELGALISDDLLAEVDRSWSAGGVLKIGGAGHCVHRDRWDVAISAIRQSLIDEAANT